MKRDENLELLYEDHMLRHATAKSLMHKSESEIDELLLSESVTPMQEEVIEELFGKTKAKLAGTKAKIGAQAGNLKNKVSTGVSNFGQKAGAYAHNAKSLAKGAGAALKGQSAPNDATSIDVDQVGNDEAEQVDPEQAQAQAKLQAILPDIKKAIGGAYTSIDNNLSSLGLDSDTLNQIDPELAKSIKYAKGWLKAAYTKLQ